MKGFLFIPPMALAACEDRKTNTRRVMTPQPVRKPGEPGCFWWAGAPASVGMMIETDVAASFCDYKAGERRCLLTTWAVPKKYDHLKPTQLPSSLEDFWHAGTGDKPKDSPEGRCLGKSRPGRFLPNHLRPLMPVFEVLAVRAERVQDITEKGAVAEGAQQAIEITPGRIPRGQVGHRTGYGLSYRRGFRELWDSINAKRGHGWKANPWVWVINFKKST